MPVPGRYDSIVNLRTWLTVLLAVLSPATGLAAEAEFFAGYAGSPPAAKMDRARTCFDEPKVREVLRQMEGGPIGQAQLDRALDGAPCSRADVTRLRLIREVNGGWGIAFAYFNADDMRAIDRAATRLVPSLVEAYLQERKAYERIFAAYPVHSVSFEKLAFVMIAGFSLNWDGLTVLKDLGYRRPILVSGDGWRYSFWASQEVPDHSVREFYWGSSTFPEPKRLLEGAAADFAFSSFGDPYSEPRMNFPDLLLTPAGKMAPEVRAAAVKLGLTQDKNYGLSDVLGLGRARDFAALLFALRHGPATREELGVKPRDPGKIDAYLELLLRTQYVERARDGRYQLLVPVLDDADRKLVDESRALSRRILSTWLQAHYAELKQELANLTVAKQGIPFEALVTQVWHEVFGLTTRQLVRSRLILDPRGANMVHPGSFPALWRHSVYQRDID